MMIGSYPNLTGCLLATSTIASGPAGMQIWHDAGTADSEKMSLLRSHVERHHETANAHGCSIQRENLLAELRNHLAAALHGLDLSECLPGDDPAYVRQQRRTKSASARQAIRPTDVYACKGGDAQASSAENVQYLRWRMWVFLSPELRHR